MMNSRKLKIGGWLMVVLLLVVAFWVSRGHDGPEEIGRDAAGPPASQEKRIRATRETRDSAANPVSKARLNHDDVIGMERDQWIIRFQRLHQDVPAEIRDEIVILSDELGKELESGMDPQGEDARAYTETILTLLAEEALGTSR